MSNTQTNTSIMQLLNQIQQASNDIKRLLGDTGESADQQYADPYDRSVVVPEDDTMTKPTIKKINQSVKKEGRTVNQTRVYYVPSLSIDKANRCTQHGLLNRYGVELPPEWHDIPVEQFTEKQYIDINRDMTRVLVPLFKQRRDGEHYHDFYYRVGLLLPPLD